MWASVFAGVAPLAMHLGPVAAESQTSRAHTLSFDQVYEEHFDFVWRSVRRLGLPDSAADDAVQDVFVVVCRRLSTFEQRSSVRTWLFGITLRVVRGHRRRDRRKPTEALPETLVSRTPDPQAASERTEALSVLDRILDQMDEDKREVFVMAELEQMTAPEIVSATGSKLNTVYSRLRAARNIFEAGVKRHRATDDRTGHE